MYANEDLSLIDMLVNCNKSYIRSIDIGMDTYMYIMRAIC